MEKHEFLRPIPGYEGHYAATEDGKIYSLNYNGTGKIRELKPGNNVSGYLYVTLCQEGKKKSFRVHRLVWLAFNGEIPDGLQINHKDEVKTNNSLDNLELMTPKENNNYGTRNKRAAEAKINHPKRSKSVLQYSKSGELLAEFPSFMEAWRQTGISHSSICQCCKGKPNYNSAGGYVWKYKNLN